MLLLHFAHSHLFFLSTDMFEFKLIFHSETIFVCSETIFVCSKEEEKKILIKEKEVKPIYLFTRALTDELLGGILKVIGKTNDPEKNSINCD